LIESLCIRVWIINFVAVYLLGLLVDFSVW